MKNNKVLIFGTLLLLVVVCSLVGGSFLVDAEENVGDELTKTWCGSADAFNSVKDDYDISSWKDVITDASKCDISGSNITCNYSLKTNGKYKVVAIAETGTTDYLEPDSDGTISFSVSAEPGSEITLYSYPKSFSNSSCDVNKVNWIDDIDRKYYIYTLTASVPASKQNGFYNTDMCKSFRDSMSKSNYSAYAESNVPECFDEDSYINILTTSDDIQTRINKVNSYVRNLNLKSDVKSDEISKLYCQFNTSKNTKNSSKDSGAVIKSFTKVEEVKDDKGNTWYKVSCTENMSISYDSPKASYSSGGFKYTVKLSSTKTCKVIPVREAVKPTVCRPSFYFSDTNTNLGGPSEDFDTCVNKCDGGIYSEECSNMCYSEIYQQGKTVNEISFLNSNLNSSFNNIEKMIYTPSTKDNKAWCSTQQEVPEARKNSYSTENDTWNWWVCPSKATIEQGQDDAIDNSINNSDADDNGVGYIKANNSGGVYGCVYGWKGGEAGCKGEMVCTNNCSSSSVETDAQADEKYSVQLTLQEQAKSKLDTTYGCTEKSDGSFSCDTTTNTTKVAMEDTTITRTVTNKGNSLANDDGIVEFSGTRVPSTSYNKDNTSSFINFPKAFISLENGSVLYKNIQNTNMLGYMFGGYLFYTDPNTTAKDTNDLRYYPYNASTFGIEDGIMASTGLKNGSTYANGKKINWNIVTSIRDFGSYNQWDIDVNCFYGADLSKCGDDPDADCDDVGDSSSICKNGDCVAGLPYLYRTVNLEDLFPDRNPGYNWTTNNSNVSSSTVGYTIDPDNLIKDIEEKGNTIYNNTPYTTLSIGKNGLNWKDVKDDGLYTEFDGKYGIKNNINFYNSKYVTNHQKTNRTN